MTGCQIIDLMARFGAELCYSFIEPDNDRLKRLARSYEMREALDKWSPDEYARPLEDIARVYRAEKMANAIFIIGAPTGLGRTVEQLANATQNSEIDIYRALEAIKNTDWGYRIEKDLILEAIAIECDTKQYFEPEAVRHTTTHPKKSPRPGHRNLKTFSYSHRRK